MKRKASSQLAKPQFKSKSALKKKQEEEEEKEEEVLSEEVSEDSEQDVSTNGDLMGDSDEEENQIVDFYDDGEVTINLPQKQKKDLFASDSEDEDEEGDAKMFTDQNKNWLKPKAQAGEASSDEGSADELDAEIKALEEKSKRKEEKRARIEKEAKLDFEENVAKQREAAEEEEEEEGEDTLEDIADRMENLYSKIQNSVGILKEFQTRRPAGVSREDFIKELKSDIIGYFGYTEFLIDMYFNLFSPAEALSHIEANETPRPLTIRVNTLKAARKELAQALINKGVTLEPIKWARMGLVIYETKQVPIGATPEYLAGHYMLQSAASFLPVIALDPQPDETVLDMCAAPGGKTTHIAALMKNSGCIHANDKNEQRTHALLGNLHRMGVRNTVVSQLDGVEFPKLPVKFDRVLVDAPCMGLGVIAKDRSIKSTKEEKDLITCIDIQIKLLLAAIDSVDISKAAVIVYSTCSISVEENEAIVNKALKKRFIKVVDAGLPFGIEGVTRYKGKEFHPSLKLSRRYYPHAHNIDGFFVCKILKFANGIRKSPEDTPTEEPETTEKQPIVLLKRKSDKQKQTKTTGAKPKEAKGAKEGKEKKEEKEEKEGKEGKKEEEEERQIDQSKVEEHTQKNKAKKQKKRARQLARRGITGEGDDDVDMTDLAPVKSGKPEKSAKPAAQAAKPAVAAQAKPKAVMTKPAQAESGGDDESARKPAAKAGKGGASPANGKANGKGAAPQKRLRGSKQ